MNDPSISNEAGAPASLRNSSEASQPDPPLPASARRTDQTWFLTVTLAAGLGAVVLFEIAKEMIPQFEHLSEWQHHVVDALFSAMVVVLISRVVYRKREALVAALSLEIEQRQRAETQARHAEENVLAKQDLLDAFLEHTPTTCTSRTGKAVLSA